MARTLAPVGTSRAGASERHTRGAERAIASVEIARFCCWYPRCSASARHGNPARARSIARPHGVRARWLLWARPHARSRGRPSASATAACTRDGARASGGSLRPRGVGRGALGLARQPVRLGGWALDRAARRARLRATWLGTAWKRVGIRPRNLDTGASARTGRGSHHRTSQETAPRRSGSWRRQSSNTRPWLGRCALNRWINEEE